MKTTAANREHKSSVFSLLFSNPKTLRELYSAIEGVELPPDVPIEINTLSNAFIKGRINDISFTIDKRLVVIVEHQSTINKNMPLRILEYIGAVYKKTIGMDKIYNEKLIKIPRPEFIVLYNGETPYPEKDLLRLSDAFMDTEGLEKENKIWLELFVQVYNINYGHNKKILQKCETLDNYSLLINKIREYKKIEITLEKSIEAAVKYCLENNVLTDFLEEYGSEVFNMLFYEYNFDTHMAVIREEGREEGREESRDYFIGLLDQGLSTEEIKQHLEQKRQ